MKVKMTLLALLFLACKNETSESVMVKSEDTVKEMSSEYPTLEVYDFEGLKPLLNRNDNKIYVVNFWATWCAPCVKELPYFEALNKTYKDKNVEVLLVSLDFPRHYEKKLKPFIKKNKLESKVVALDDTDSNTWIPAIDKDWSGAIPATIIYNSKERKFYERSFNYQELETELKQFLK
jgi:thiol-disulfide isomerase/thioredoxin